MSSRQYTMMGNFMTTAYTLDEVAGFSQVTLGSLLYRKWVKQKDDKLEITNEGKAAYHRYGSEDISRKNFQAALSRWIKGR
jgi:hypothetical protein